MSLADSRANSGTKPGAETRAHSRRAFTHNVVSLYAVHAANILLPLATVPYVARVLRPTAWGLIAYAQAASVYLTMVIGYGFNNAGTREVARHRHDPAYLRQVVSGVVGVKLLLSLLAVLLAVAIQHSVPTFRPHPLLFYSAAAWGIFQGLGSVWYFQGVEDLKVAAVVEVASKALGTCAVFLFVRRPQDAWKMPALLAAGSLLADLVEFGRMYARVGAFAPTAAAVAAALRIGWTWFTFEIALVLQATAGTLLLGTLATPAAVAFYSSAERLTRTVRVSIDPITRALFPRLSYLARHDPEEGQRLVARALPLFAVASCLAGAFLLLGAPLLVRILLGRGYESAVPVLRLFAAMPPLYALSVLLGNLWAYPLGYDKAVSRLMIAASAASVAMALFLIPRFGPAGMAASVVAGQAMLLTSYCYLLSRAGRAPGFAAKAGAGTRAAARPAKPAETSAAAEPPGAEAAPAATPAGAPARVGAARAAA